jgi:hypothetical protein
MGREARRDSVGGGRELFDAGGEKPPITPSPDGAMLRPQRRCLAAAVERVKALLTFCQEEQTMIIYVLMHIHVMPDGSKHEKRIGYYSSRKNAQSAMTRACKLPGFCDLPDGFEIVEFKMDQDNWSGG